MSQSWNLPLFFCRIEVGVYRYDPVHGYESIYQLTDADGVPDYITISLTDIAYFSEGELLYIHINVIYYSSIPGIDLEPWNTFFSITKLDN